MINNHELLKMAVLPSMDTINFSQTTAMEYFVMLLTGSNHFLMKNQQSSN